MKFKKQLCILLTFSLLVSNLGLAYNVHYCEDKVASVSFQYTTDTSTAEMGCCGEVEKEAKCCKNKIIKSEVKSDQIMVKSFSIDTEYIPLVTNWDSFYLISTPFSKPTDSLTYYCDAHAPPLYLLYSQYTFYA